MACAGCGKRNPNPKTLAPGDGIDFTLLVPSDHVVNGLDRKLHSIRGSVLENRPMKGSWAVDVKVKDRDVRISGPNPNRIFAQVKEIYADNKVEIEDDTIWFNLNRIWLQRTTQRHVKVTLEDLDTLLEPKLDQPDINLYDPQEWGHKAWGFLGLLLAADDFDEEHLASALDIFYFLLKDEEIGCEECLAHFIERIQREPDLSTRDKARVWMWETMNDIRQQNNKPQYTFEQASKIHHWDNN